MARIPAPEMSVTLRSPMAALFYGLCWYHKASAQILELDTTQLVAVADGLAYCPDFWVFSRELGLDMAVEISDGEREDLMAPLRSAWRDAFRKPLRVVYRENLDELLETSKPVRFAARLKMGARLPSAYGLLLVHDVPSRWYMFALAGPGEDIMAQQTLYWTKSGTLACGECDAEVSSGDGKTAPYVIDHPADCPFAGCVMILAS